MWWRISLPEAGAGAWSERLRTSPSPEFKEMPSFAAVGRAKPLVAAAPGWVMILPAP
jgi:hypothetical protein